MKNISFIIDDDNGCRQNIYVTYTGGGSRIITELFCIATSETHARSLVICLNKLSDDLKKELFA